MLPKKKKSQGTPEAPTNVKNRLFKGMEGKEIGNTHGALRYECGNES